MSAEVLFWHAVNDVHHVVV